MRQRRLRLGDQRLLVIGLWLVVLVTAWHQHRQAVSSGEFGVDFGSVWGAAMHLDHGQALYANTASGGGFVYLPSAALLFLPFLALTQTHAAELWVVICLVALTASCLVVVRTFQGPGWLAPVSALVMINSSPALGLHVANVDLILPLLVALMTWAVAADRRRTSALVNGLSLAIKPLILAPSLLMLLERRWRAVADTLVVPVILIIPVFLLVPQTSSFLTHTVPFLGGSEDPVTQHASLAVVSRLASAPAALRVAARILVSGGGLGVSALVWRRPASYAVRWLETVVVLQISLGLGGSFSFAHHLALVLLLVPAAAARDALSRQWPVLVSLLIFAVPKPAGTLVDKDCVALILVLVTMGLAAWRETRAATGAHRPAERDHPCAVDDR